jgi:hypothetical protein
MNRRVIGLLAMVAAGHFVAVNLVAQREAAAGEPAAAFLDGLRERGYFDVAIDYLDAAAKNPAVPVEFKNTMLYERGVTLVQGAKVQRDPVLREKQLDEGQRQRHAHVGDFRPQPARQRGGRARPATDEEVGKGFANRQVDAAHRSPHPLLGSAETI